MWKYWIFDWSGTLVDDMGLVLDATNFVLRQYGKAEIDRDEFRAKFCLPYRDFYAEYLPGVDMEEVEAHFRHGFDHSEVAVTVLPHAREFLDTVRASGGKMYVLTSMCAKAFSEQVVELGMNDYFEKTYAGVLDKREVIGSMLDRHGMDKDSTVFVGDMTHDVDTAHHAKIASVGVLTGYNLAPALAVSEPNVMVKDLDMLGNLCFKKERDLSEEWVKIRGLELTTFIGVPDEERAEKQLLKVDVEMLPKKKFHHLNDEIEGGVDYYQVSLRLEEIALEKPRKLIETLARDLAQVVKDEFEVSQVKVEIRKFIMPNTEFVGVSYKA